MKTPNQRELKKFSFDRKLVITIGYYGRKTHRLEAIVARMREQYPEAEIVLKDLKPAKV